MKKLISLIAILLLLTLVFASCVDEGKEPIETTAEQSTVTEPQSTTTPITEPATDFDAPEGTIRNKLSISMSYDDLLVAAPSLKDRMMYDRIFFRDNDGKIVMVCFDENYSIVEKIKTFEGQETLVDDSEISKIKVGMSIDEVIEIVKIPPSDAGLSGPAGVAVASSKGVYILCIDLQWNVYSISPIRPFD